MAATERCDVYSFGVVALETIMGRHPGELLSSLSAFKSVQDLMLNVVLDSRLPRPADVLVQQMGRDTIRVNLHSHSGCADVYLVTPWMLNFIVV